MINMIAFMVIFLICFWTLINRIYFVSIIFLLSVFPSWVMGVIGNGVDIIGVLTLIVGSGICLIICSLQLLFTGTVEVFNQLVNSFERHSFNSPPIKQKINAYSAKKEFKDWDEVEEKQQSNDVKSEVLSKASKVRGPYIKNGNYYNGYDIFIKKPKAYFSKANKDAYKYNKKVNKFKGWETWESKDD